MKALKTVAVALGITLAALIVIPLAVLAGLFVWLKLTEEEDEELLELDRKAPERPRRPPRGRPPRPAGVDCPATDARRSTGGRPTVRATAGWPRSPSSSSWSSGPATSSSSRASIGVLPPVGFTFLRYCMAAVALLAILRWREGAIRLPRPDVASDPVPRWPRLRAATRSCGRSGSRRSRPVTPRC